MDFGIVDDSAKPGVAPSSWSRAVLLLGLAAALASIAPGCDRSEDRNAAVAPVEAMSSAGADAVDPPASAPVELRKVDEFPGEPGSLASCNVLLVTLDTTRADHIGCYGYRNIETPTLDRLASEGVLFEQAKAVAPHTLASHTSILTGLYPASHGARVNWFHRLDDSKQTIAETLRDDDYQTAAFVSAFVLLSRFGIAQGFAHYDDDLSAGQAPERGAQHVAEETPERRGDITADRALQWLRGAAGDRFFIWVHFFDPHMEYHPPEPYLTRYRNAPYDGEIAFADAMLGRLIAALDELDLADSTLVVVVGDHGESLGQHNEKTHGLMAYEPTIRVPLIFRCGKRLGGGVSVSARASQVDVVPTVLSLLGVAPPTPLQGADLTEPTPPERPIYFETLHGLMYHGWAPIAGVYQGDFKYIESPNPELYDLSGDSGELSNLCDIQPETAARLRGLLPALFGDNLEQLAQSGPTTRPDDADLRKLEALGYIGAGGVPDVAVRHDPKEMVLVLDRLYAAISSDSYDEIIANVRPIVDEYPDFHAAWKYLAKAYGQKGDIEKGAEALEKCRELLPDAPETNYDLALVRVHQQRLEEAIPLLENVAASSPGRIDAPYLLGVTLHELGRPEEAAAQMRRVFAIDPEYEKCAEALATFFSQAGRAEEAPVLFRKRLAAEPRSPRVCTALADVLATQKRFAEAAEVLRNGAATMPDEPQVLRSLAKLLVGCPDRSVRNLPAATDLLERYRDRAAVPDPAAMYTLATIYAQQQRIPEAIKTATSARSAAAAAGDQQLATEIEKFLSRLRGGGRGTKP